MNAHRTKDASAVTVILVAAWTIAIAFVQWILHGSQLDLEKLTGLPQ